MVFAQVKSTDDASERRTDGLVNGRFWQILSDDQRPIFLIAMVDALTQFQLMADHHDPGKTKDHQQIIDYFLAPKFSYQEMANEITKLYDGEPANLRIPVVMMEIQGAIVLNGGTSDAVETHMAAMRKIFNH